MEGKSKLVFGKEQITILTLAPESWNIKKTIKQFGVTEHKVEYVRELKKKHGIVADPNPKMGKKLDDDVCNLVTHFFQEDEYSRCPGMKDFV